MAKFGLSEILQKTSEQPEEERGEFLRRNWNPTLGQLIRYAYDESFVWALPEGAPPYKPNEYLDQESNLYNEVRRLYIFMEGSGDHVPQKRKELLFMQLLENLSKTDAELLIAVKDGNLPYGITQEFVINELPGQLTTPRVTKEEAPSVATFQIIPGSPAAERTVETPNPVVKRKTTKRKTTTRKTAAKKTVVKKADTADK